MKNNIFDNSKNIIDLQFPLLNEERLSFDNFKSEVCHRLNTLGDKLFLYNLLVNRWIEKYFYLEWNLEAFYLLGLSDYLTLKLELPLFSHLSNYRTMKLSELIFPLDIELLSNIQHSNNIKTKIINECKNDIIGKEFYKYNIIEKDIYNVC